MFPVVNVGPVALQVPGLILLLGYWISTTVAGRLAKAAGLSEDAISNASFVALFAGLIGARLGYVALHWSAYQNDLAGIAALTTGALSTSAGLLIGGGAAALYLRRRFSSVARLRDVLAPAVALMFAFISFADLSSGSAFGMRSDLPWAIQLWGARRHPTQLYELITALITLGILLWVHRRRPYDGFSIQLFLLVYGMGRLFLDAFRADPWLLPGGFRTVQVIGLGAAMLALWLMSQRAVQTAQG